MDPLPAPAAAPGPDAPSGPPPPAAPHALATERLVLHEVLPAEAAELVAGRTCGREWLGGTPGAGTREAAGLLTLAAEAGCHAPRWALYRITRRHDGVSVGGIGFHGPPADGGAEIGFDLAPGARGRGYATEALRALGAWALDQPGVHRVTATAARANRPSQRVMDRAGFTRTADVDGMHAYELTGVPDRP
ncbi:GNAT family N-acetyltransferase [Streptacidiphilus sp. ASG 303]|uniref:GNAT family N-acetyltransferase n=1 Tax=Streptacidiphilus sp. ASG 303 TaxID=2896847 RepID=UPI001E29C132|nr:GNAT family protein [Streptacidiphilus sp. ASG 303]MCD0485188.1 GNAT family N-acetyltransferase [Streptacidiphilus sp. ASG 303]